MPPVDSKNRALQTGCVFASWRPCGEASDALTSRGLVGCGGPRTNLCAHTAPLSAQPAERCARKELRPRPRARVLAAAVARARAASEIGARPAGPAAAGHCRLLRLPRPRHRLELLAGPPPPPPSPFPPARARAESSTEGFPAGRPGACGATLRRAAGRAQRSRRRSAAHVVRAARAALSHESWCGHAAPPPAQAAQTVACAQRFMRQGREVPGSIPAQPIH